MEEPRIDAHKRNIEEEEEEVDSSDAIDEQNEAEEEKMNERQKKRSVMWAHPKLKRTHRQTPPLQRRVVSMKRPVGMKRPKHRLTLFDSGSDDDDNEDDDQDDDYVEGDNCKHRKRDRRNNLGGRSEHQPQHYSRQAERAASSIKSHSSSSSFSQRLHRLNRPHSYAELYASDEED
jgi:hypothetical protein